jgi:hypothetical protein
LKRVAGTQATVVWHPSQLPVLNTCVTGFGVAKMREPCEWQALQMRGVDLKIALM